MGFTPQHAFLIEDKEKFVDGIYPADPRRKKRKIPK